MADSKIDKPKVTSNQAVIEWVEQIAALTRPDKIHWCDGSEQEKERLSAEAIASGEIEALDPQKLPGCVLHRTARCNISDASRSLARYNITGVCLYSARFGHPDVSVPAHNDITATRRR